MASVHGLRLSDLLRRDLDNDPIVTGVTYTYFIVGLSGLAPMVPVLLSLPALPGPTENDQTVPIGVKSRGMS